MMSTTTSGTYGLLHGNLSYPAVRDQDADVSHPSAIPGPGARRTCIAPHAAIHRGTEGQPPAARSLPVIHMQHASSPLQSLGFDMAVLSQQVLPCNVSGHHGAHKTLPQRERTEETLATENEGKCPYAHLRACTQPTQLYAAGESCGPLPARSANWLDGLCLAPCSM